MREAEIDRQTDRWIGRLKGKWRGEEGGRKDGKGTLFSSFQFSRLGSFEFSKKIKHLSTVSQGYLFNSRDPCVHVS